MVVNRINRRKVCGPIVIELVILADADEQPEERRNVLGRPAVDDADAGCGRLEADVYFVHSVEGIPEQRMSRGRVLDLAKVVHDQLQRRPRLVEERTKVIVPLHIELRKHRLGIMRLDPDRAEAFLSVKGQHDGVQLGRARAFAVACTVVGPAVVSGIAAGGLRRCRNSAASGGAGSNLPKRRSCRLRRETTRCCVPPAGPQPAARVTLYC